MTESKLNDMIRTSLESIREIAEADTIIGNPVNAGNGTVIIPVSKVSMGFASGGVDFYGKGDKQKEAQPPKTPLPGKIPNFGGGGGTGLTITPICFIVTKPDGTVEMLSVSDNSSSIPAVGVAETVSSFIEKSPEIISRIKAIFSKEKKTEPLDDEKLKDQMAADAVKQETASE